MCTRQLTVYERAQPALAGTLIGYLYSFVISGLCDALKRLVPHWGLIKKSPLYIFNEILPCLHLMLVYSLRIQ